MLCELRISGVLSNFSSKVWYNDIPYNTSEKFKYDITKLAIHKAEGLDHSFYDLLKKLTNLQKLDLVYNQLTSLPDSLGDLKNLQKLGLNNNQLTSLPENIGKLKNLQELNLGYNSKIRITAGDILKFRGKTGLQSYLIEIVKDEKVLRNLEVSINNLELKERIQNALKKFGNSR